MPSPAAPAAAARKSSSVTPAELRSHPYYAKLNERQTLFVDALIENGNDRIAAAHAAWKCSSDESARSMAHKAMKNEAVAFLVDQYYGGDPARQRFSRDQALEFAAQKARSAADLKLALDYLRLIAAMEGWLTKAAEKAPEAPTDDSQEAFEL